MSTILVGDDNAANRELLSVILQRAGFTTVEAADGAEVLRQLESNSPVAVLVDIHMPEIDGFEVLRRIRQDPRFAKLPVIAVTASVMTGDEQNALKSGFDAYLAKPYEPKQVVALLRRVLDQTSNVA